MVKIFTTINNIQMLFLNITRMFNISYLDQIWFVPERELEGAVALGETESAGPVVTLEIMLLHRSTVDQHQD